MSSFYHSVDQVRSPMIARLHQWWSASGGDDIPDRAEFDPQNFTSLLPNILLLDVEHQPFRVAIVWSGTRPWRRLDSTSSGKYLDELMPTEPEAPWLDIYRQSYDERRAIIGTSTCTTTTGGLFTHEYGIFPLRKGGKSVDQFMAIEDYGDLVSNLTDLVHWSAREQPATK